MSRYLGMPVMICHLAECLMDRALDCRWDPATTDEIFRGAISMEGALRIGYMGELRSLKFLSETVREYLFIPFSLFSLPRPPLFSCFIIPCFFPIM